MITTDSNGLHFLTFTLYWYGIIVIAAGWIAAEVATILAARESRNQGDVWRGLIWIFLGAIIGARLWFILFPPDSVVANGRTAAWFLTHFLDLNQGFLAAWTGGLGLIGAIIGGALGLVIYTRRRKRPVAPWLDIAAIALALGQAVGRWANGINGELYGPPTSLPWGVLISNSQQRVEPYTDLARYPLTTTRFQPVFAYESLLALVIFVVLLAIFLRRRTRPGDIALLYVSLYGVGRFLLEFIRINVSHVGAINISQLVALIAAGGALLALIARRGTSGTTNAATNRGPNQDDDQSRGADQRL